MKSFYNFLFRYFLQKSRVSLLLCISIAYSTAVCSQGETNNWFFGANAGVTFNGGVPVGLPNGALVSGEGVSSISDVAGNVLMYTDGSTIYDRNDNVMPNGNGLFGGNSSSQSAIIIRRPGSNNIYYVFTVAQAALPEGICFSTVNMSLNGGLGDVIAATKNTPLLTPSTEKLSAVKHCNGRDIWVIGHGYNNAVFHAWLVTPTGVNTIPITSTSGSDHGTSVIGCLKVSPDGKKLALAVYEIGSTQYIEVFDFNNNTGIVSNPRRFNYGDDCYGIEFSPNSELLYYTASANSSASDIKVYQMDVCETTQANMAASAQIIGASSAGFIRSLQLGPDGKLYFTRFGQGWIGVIDSPNTPGAGCGFNVNGVALSPGTACRAGLPNFNQSLFEVEEDFTFTQNCLSASFSSQIIIDDASCNDPVVQTLWNFGEPSSGAANTSSIINPSHTYANPGNYNVRLIINYSCKKDTLYQLLNVNCGPVVTTRDTIICSGTCATLNSSTIGGTPGYTYSWSPNIGNGPGPYSVCPVSTTNYILTVTDAGGLIDKDTATVTISTVPNPTFTYDHVNCFGGTDGDATALSTGAGGPFTYSWNTTPVTNTAALVNVAAGTYQVTVRNVANCTRTANATITQPTQLTLTVNKTNTGCGVPTGTATAVPSGGTAPYIVTWNSTPSQSGLTANALPAGNFIATVTDANGCTQTQAFTINSSSGPTLNLTTSTNVTCNGGTNGTATVLASAGATPYTYSWSTGQTTASVNNLPAGNHTATVTDNNGCSSSVPVVITSPTAIQIQTSITIASCELANGSATALASGGTPNYTYSWNTTPVQNTASANNIIPGNYTVTATDASGCSATATVTATGTSNPTITIAKTNVSCFGGNNGTATATTGLGTAPFTVTWSNAATGLTVNNLTTGNYTATVTDGAGCNASANFTITQPSAISLATSSVAATCGSSNGSAAVVISGGTGPFSTQWNTSPVSNGLVINNISAGSYVVTVTDNNSCTANTTVAISNSSGPTLNLTSSTNVTCNGGANGTASVLASAGATPYTYNWSTGQTTATVNNLPAGNHTATVTDNNGCSSSVPVVITSPSAIQIQTSFTIASCGLANGSATALASGGTPNYTYSWNTTPAQNTATANNIIAGNYTVTATDASGCSATATATVTGTSNPIINIATTDVLCYGGNSGTATSTISAGTAPFIVTWSNAATGLTVSNLIAGNYTATVTDGAGCSASANFTITQPIAISLATSSTSATCGSSNGSAIVTIGGGAGPFVTQWNTSPVSNGLSINNISVGSYIVTVTDNNGCTSNATVAVSNNSGPTLNLTVSTNVSCNGGTNGTATVLASSGATPYTYSWSTGQTTAAVNNLPAGNHTATVTDNNGCSSSVPVFITAPTAIQIQTSITIASCGLANGSATALASGGTPNYTYSWNTTPVQNTATANNIIAGNYTVTATDANGCSATAAVIVTGTSNPTISIAKTNVSCFGGNNGTATATIGAGTAPFTVTWSNAATGLTVNNLIAGNYTATVTDAVGCLASDSNIISEPNEITTQINITDAACGTATGGANLIINGGTSPYAVSWNSLPIQNGLNLTNVLAGLYTAQITDGNGCTLNVDAQISNLSGPQIALVSSNNISCFGGNDGNIQVNISGGQSPLALTWNSGQNSSTISSLIAGNYTATLTDAIGCSANLSVSLNEPAALTNSIITTPTTCGNNNGTATTQITGGVAPYIYNWNNTGNGSSTISNLAPGNQQVIIEDANGCLLNENFTITALVPPNVNISIDNNISCPGGNNGSLSATVNQGEAPFIYNWSNGNSNTIISNLSQGNYSVTITDNNGCTVNDALQLDAPSPWSNIIIPQASTCGNNNGSALLLINGATSPYSVVWNDGQTLPNAIDLLPGIYTVSISDANGCTKTEQTTIFDIGGLAVVLNQTQQISCFGFTDAEISATGNGGVPPYTFSWSNGGNTNLAIGVAAGNISCNVTDANGCVASSSLNISQPAAIAAAFTTQHTTCNLNNGSTSINVSGGTAPYFYNWHNGNQTNFITSLAAGQITCTVSDVNGCISNFNETINPSLAISASLNIDQPISCFQGNNGAVSVNSTSNLSATWSNNTIGLTNSNLSAGNYSAILVDQNACRDTLSVTLNEPSSISTSFLNTETVCALNNGNSTISISGGTSPYTCLWSNGITGFQNANLLPGNQSVIITDANGCILNVTTTINQIFPLNIDTIEVTPSICFGEANGSATTIVSGNTGNISWNWSNGQTDAITIDSLFAGIYSVNVSDDAGCILNQTFTIDQPLPLQNTIQTNKVRCFGENSGSAISIASGGTGSYEYLWDQIPGNDTLNFLQAGSYSVTILDSFGCNRSDTFSIQEPTLLQASINKTNATCGLPNGQMEVVVSGGTIPYQYIWSDGTQLNTIGNLIAGNYSVNIIDSVNCVTTSVDSIIDPGAPIIDTITLQNIDCFGNATGFIEVVATGGIGNKSYSWNNGETSSIISNQIAGIYTVTAQDQIGCSDTLSIQLTEPTKLETNTSTSTAICFGSATGQASVEAFGGTAPYTYYWNENQNQQSFLTQMLAGTYTVSVTDANGCVNYDTAFVSQPSALQLELTASPALCYGQPSGEANAVISGGIPPYNLSWNNGVSGAYIDQLLAGSYVIVATDSNGCTISQGIEVAQPLPLNGLISGDVSACKGQNIFLIVSGDGGTYPYTYLWENGDYDSNTSFTPDSSGFATVITSDANGCVDTSSRQFEIFELPLLSIISPDTSLCAGQCINLTAADVEGGQFVWNFLNNGNILGQTAEFCSNAVGNYNIYLEVTDINGCFNSFNYDNYIQVNPNPIVDFEPDKRTVPLLDALIKFDNNSIGATSYLWDLDSEITGDESNLQNPKYQYIEVGSYEVTLTGTNEFGCSATISRFVDILADFAVYIPNAFTPNNDGVNDTFQPDGIGIDPSDYYMQIYDRWGKLLFETDIYSKGWDGTIEESHNDSKQTSNVYVYKIRIKDFRGDYHKYNGTATLVR